MNVTGSLYKTMDRAALKNLHRNRSKKSHFRCEEAPLTLEEETISSFYPLPQIPNVQFNQTSNVGNYSHGKYQFPSGIQSDYEVNDTANGLYYTKAAAKVTCVLVHGWRMDNLERITSIYLQDFMKLGFNIYLPKLPYHSEREPVESQYCGELMISTDVDRTLQAIRQSVLDLRALIGWLKSVGQKVILIGVSLGGLMTNLTAAMEEHIDLLISVFHPTSLSYLVWNSIPGMYLKQDFMKHGFTYERLIEHWSILDPSFFSPKISKERILLFSGLHDQYVPFEDSSKLWEPWDKPKRIIYSCGHAALVLSKNRIRTDTLEFIRNSGIGGTKS
jgi:dienelactone hydrolase